MRLLQMSVSGALLIVLTALLRKAALRILPKRAFLLFWGIVLIRLLVPFPPVIRVTLPEVFSEQRAAAPMENLPAGESAQTNPSASPRPAQPPKGAAVRDAAENGSALKSQENRISSWPVVIRTVWTAGAVFMGLFFLTGYAAGYRKFRQAFPVEHDAARAWMAAHPLRRAYAVKSFGGLDAPMTWGVLRPVILAPGSETWWSSPEAKFALEHEYIHMRRFDAALKSALALALSLHWFNPAVWAFYALANRDMELSCDEAVLLHQKQRSARRRIYRSEFPGGRYAL